uniref:Uncharacterized protein n=1 Tax=Acrobeloides nanus TaxID=290746 RepID=A0A914EHQ5_9BILA
MNSCFQELPNYCQIHDCGCKQEDSKPICKPTSRIGALVIDEFPYINVIGGYHTPVGTHRAVVFDLPEETEKVWRFNIFTRTWKAI